MAWCFRRRVRLLIRGPADVGVGSHVFAPGPTGRGASPLRGSAAGRRVRRKTLLAVPVLGLWPAGQGSRTPVSASFSSVFLRVCTPGFLPRPQSLSVAMLRGPRPRSGFPA
jgi:hypothetical protein